MHLGPPVGKSAHGNVGRRTLLMSPREELSRYDKVYTIIVLFFRISFLYLSIYVVITSKYRLVSISKVLTSVLLK